MPILCVFRQKTETSRHRPITLSLSLNINKGRCLQVAFTEPWDSWTTVCFIFYAHYKSLEFMFLNKTIPVFTAATLYSNIRSLTLSVANAYHTLDPTKTKKDPVYYREDVSSSNNISIDLEQTKDAYQSKDTLELLRSFLVFKLCSYDILVDRNKEVCNAFNAYNWIPLPVKDVQFCFAFIIYPRVNVLLFYIEALLLVNI